MSFVKKCPRASCNVAGFCTCPRASYYAGANKSLNDFTCGGATCKAPLTVESWIGLPGASGSTGISAAALDLCDTLAFWTEGSMFINVTSGSARVQLEPNNLLCGPSGPTGSPPAPHRNFIYTDTNTGILHSWCSDEQEWVPIVGGATGLRGATGPQGPQGVTGAQGVTGLRGATGSTGPQGIQGVTGVQGVTGSSYDFWRDSSWNLPGPNGVNVFAQRNADIAVGVSGSLYIGDRGIVQNIAIGVQAGEFSSGSRTVSIGYFAGFTGQQGNSVAIGSLAGGTRQSSLSVAVGPQAGLTDQSGNCVAVGYLAGSSNQGSGSVCLGNSAGQNSCGAGTICIGNSSSAIGFTGCVVLGHGAVGTSGAQFCVRVNNSVTTEFKTGFQISSVPGATTHSLIVQIGNNTYQIPMTIT